eukprot:scaffold3040_cov152-Amphora_coffeaeformis.AAC.2
MTASFISLPPPSRPKKKRHSGEWHGSNNNPDDEEEEEAHGGLADFVVNENDGIANDKNTRMTTRRKIPFAQSAADSDPQEQQHLSASSTATTKQSLQSSATTASLRVKNSYKLPPSSSQSSNNAFRLSSLAAASSSISSATPPSSAKRMTRQREDPRWNQVSHLTPVEQSRLYWTLCYGSNDNSNNSYNNNTAGHSLPPTWSAKRKPPARGVLKRPKKRSRQEQTSDDAFDSPQASTASTEDAFCTPVGDANTHHLVSQKARTSSRVKFGPSQAVCFDGGTPVAGGLEPLPAADVQFPSDMPEEPEEETNLVEETKANAACLAAWDDVVLSDDDDDDDIDGSFVIAQPVRLGRRSSTFFSPSAKSLLDEPDPSSLRADSSSSEEDEDDDDDPMTTSLDPSVDCLLLSSLQVNSPTMEEAPRLGSPTTGISKVSPSETSKDRTTTEEASSDEEKLSSPECILPTRQSVSPTESNRMEECDDRSDETCLLLQLLQRSSSPNEWIQCFQGSRPLQMLLSAAMDACAKQIAVSDDTMDLPPPYQTLTADVRLMQGVLQHMKRLHRQAASAHDTLLGEGLAVLDTIRPPAFQTRVSAEEAEIALLERAIAREEEALAIARKRRLERQLAQDQRQLVEWKALSSILADIDFPREDDTSPTGLAYGFSVTQLACEVVLRPAADGTLDSATLDVMEKESGTGEEDLPAALKQMFRVVLSDKLSGLLEGDAAELDFQQAARQVIVFLGRLDRIIDDLTLACQRWDHDVSTDETATSLRVHVAPSMSICLNWQASSAFVLEYAYPSQVELTKGDCAETLEADHPPSLRSLWKKVIVGKEISI